jgi:hypothetical protein
MDFSTTVAAEYSHRIDFSVWLDRCNMQLHSFRYRVLLSIARLLILLHFAELEFSVIHCIFKYNEVASSFKSTFSKVGRIWNIALSKWTLLLINRYYSIFALKRAHFKDRQQRSRHFITGLFNAINHGCIVRRATLSDVSFLRSVPDMPNIIQVIKTDWGIIFLQ